MSVDKLIAFIAEGEDSFMSMTINAQTFAAVTSVRNEETLAQMERAMIQIARSTGITIHKVRFSNPELLAAITPEGVVPLL